MCDTYSLTSIELRNNALESNRGLARSSERTTAAKFAAECAAASSFLHCRFSVSVASIYRCSLSVSSWIVSTSPSSSSTPLSKSSISVKMRPSSESLTFNILRILLPRSSAECPRQYPRTPLDQSYYCVFRSGGIFLSLSTPWYSQLFRKKKKKNSAPNASAHISKVARSPCAPVPLSMVQKILTVEEQCAII